jgi:hypothetical protein
MTAAGAPMRIATPSAAWSDCRLCGCRLIAGTAAHPTGDDTARGLCRDCVTRPEAARFGVRAPGPQPSAPARPAAAPPAAAGPAGPRGFNPADRALIRHLRQLPAAELLDILNARASAEPKHVPFTMAQLAEEVAKVTEVSARDGEWASLRKLLARARTSGVLATITAQVVDDFAVVFSLSPAQHMHLRDVIKNAQEDR